MDHRITASEVKNRMNFLHDDTICCVTEVNRRRNGSISVSWTEEHNGRKMYFSGSFNPNAYLGEQAPAW